MQRQMNIPAKRVRELLDPYHTTIYHDASISSGRDSSGVDVDSRDECREVKENLETCLEQLAAIGDSTVIGSTVSICRCRERCRFQRSLELVIVECCDAGSSAVCILRASTWGNRASMRSELYCYCQQSPSNMLFQIEDLQVDV